MLPSELNQTLVCLILKNKHPKQMSDFRPIALCNVLMRILSKPITNRLKPCVQSIVSANQSAFLEGKLLMIMLLSHLKLIILFIGILKEGLELQS